MDDLEALMPPVLETMSDAAILHLGQELAHRLFDMDEYWGLQASGGEVSLRTAVFHLAQALIALECYAYGLYPQSIAQHRKDED